MANKCALTTVDNPFDPFEEFTSWFLFDEEKSQRKDCSLCAVGDVDQSIYSWRGADYKIILNFQKDYKNTKLIKLEQNYRSTGNILNAANEVIQNNVERLDKNLYSTKGDGDKIIVFEAESDYDESLYTAKKIKELNKAGVPYEDIAVLYRTNAQSRGIEEALMSNNIPYKIVGGLRFYERKEIKDIVAYLKLIYNKHDNQSLRRVINVPKRGIGDTTLKKIFDIADEKEISAFDVIEHINDYPDFSSRHTGVLLNFANMINSLIEKQTNFELSEFASLVMEETGYIRELRSEDTVENQSRLDNLQEFINVIKEFEDDDFEIDEEEDLGILGNFLSQVALVSDVDEMKEEEKSTVLMTLHAAKGLEFKNVFIVGVEDELFPSLRSTDSIQELEEERRLLYVAITRAKEHCVMTYATSRYRNGQTHPCSISRFINDIDPAFIKISGSYKRDIDRKYGGYRRLEKPANRMESIFRQSTMKPLATVKDGADIAANNSNSLQAGALHVGMRVGHSRFGNGEILKIDGVGIDTKVTIRFDNVGTKVLLTKFAQLSILS